MRVDGINSILSSVPFVEIQPIQHVKRENGPQYVQVAKEKSVVVDTIAPSPSSFFTLCTKPAKSTLSQSETDALMHLIEKQKNRLEYLTDFPGLYKA